VFKYFWKHCSNTPLYANINKREDLGVVKEVLMLYVEDSFKKIEIFDELSQKIKLFLDIINKRFKHKQLFINKESGFLLKSTKIKDENGEFKNISVTKLSSGEQNELVLFYLLLFQTEKNSMILIDEPEVSLHISWQNNFINDLKQIRELNNLEVIIATHSPDIINGNWDLTERLVGIE
jgi:predicted ATP-binding protein involved in virulence